MEFIIHLKKPQSSNDDNVENKALDDQVTRRYHYSSVYCASLTK